MLPAALGKQIMTGVWSSDVQIPTFMFWCLQSGGESFFLQDAHGIDNKFWPLAFQNLESSHS